MDESRQVLFNRSYVSTSSGGSRSAAQRMGSSRIAGARLLGFLSDAIANGSRQALRTLNLENLAGQRIEQVFIGMMDYVCPEGGTVDEGIAREAFIETIGPGCDDSHAHTAPEPLYTSELRGRRAGMVRMGDSGGHLSRGLISRKMV